MSTKIKPDVNRVAAVFGCTPEQTKRLFATNAAQMRAMATKATRTGKVNGYTVEQLNAHAAKCEEAAQ